MKSVQAIRRFISTSWLVAAPLIIVFLLIAIPIFLAVIQAIISRLFGAEAADKFFDLWFGAMMWAGELVLGLGPIALAIYGIFRLTRWIVGKKAP